MIKTTIEGIQRTQQANLKIIRAVKPENGLGRWANYVTVSIHRYVVGITHVITGSLKASQRMVHEGPARYRIYIDPSSKNPKTGQYPSLYGVIEHNRGGRHSFYERAVSAAPSTLSAGANLFMRELP